jgi:hypothetical protein
MQLTKLKLIVYLVNFFRETNAKVDITWNLNSTVSYRLVRHFYYDAENSNGSLDDYITTLDIAALVRIRKKIKVILHYVSSSSSSSLSSS